MRNVNSERVLFIPRSYSSLSEGRRNEDCRYALLLFAMEVVSFLLDLFGGSHWGYLWASFLLSVLVLETTIYAYFIKRSTINSEAQQLIAVEIVFSVIQLIISCYCLIKTLSGVETKYSSSVFPLTYAAISVFFTFKSKNDVLHSSSNTPSNQVGIVERTGESELEITIADPPDPTPVPMPASDANVDPPDPTHVSVPASDANVDPSDPTSVSAPASDANVDPTSVSVPASDANVDPPAPMSVSMPASDANVDPPDSMLVPLPASDAKVPEAKMLRRRNRQTQLSSVHLKELVFKVNLPNAKAKNKAMTTLSRISGVESIQVDMKEQKLTLKATGEVDPVHLVNKLRKQCNPELISVGPAKQPKTRMEKRSEEYLHFGAPYSPNYYPYPYYYSAPQDYHHSFSDENPNACVVS